ncbi:Ig-like domain-containing protein [Nocardioides pelophilus]|uniref:Ig-like domain-containing protein n=1 Tax=Nocardioides pelophilus TaxID=2172019 RepID=UPI0016045AD5|nr:Ig-like domain-containing protein [Nocardioides pelophilus]
MSLKSRVAAAIPSQRTRTVGAFTALTLALATLAVLHDGVEVSDLDLHDGGVWVTNLDLDGVPMAAHLNYESRELDSYTELASTDSDVSQEANEVVLHDLRGHGIQSVDTATWDPSSTAKLPKIAGATQGRDIVAVADPTAGSVWALPVEETSTFDPASLAPVLEGNVGVRAVVGKDDVIHTVTPDGTLRDLTRVEEGWTVEEVGATPTIGEGDEVVLSAVGDTGVVLNKTAGWVAWTDHRTDVDGAESLELQQPGDDADVITLAGPSGLWQVPLDGDDPGDPITTPAGGRPAAPVVVGTCTYAAWAGTGWYVRDCDDDSADISQAYPEQLSRRGVPNSRLVFRTNRDKVTLNDVGNGDIILVNENMLLLDDPWETIRQEIEQDEQDDRNQETIEFRRNKKNEPPQPTDDEFGVRAGRPVTLPVLGNDTDPDGDVLTLSLADGAEKVPGLGELQLVRDGRAVRLVVDDDATGTHQFDYTADDGRPNGTAPAAVSVTVRPQELNEGVRLVTPKRPSKMTIRSRGAGEHHILQEWVDQDGDPFWVDNVEFPKGMTGTFRPDGYIRVVDDGRERPGDRPVTVTLTDGRETGTIPVDLMVTVKPADGRTEPIAQADFVTVLAGQEVDVRPLRNDVDPGGGDLYLELDREIPRELDVTQNNDDSLTITGQKAGTHYIEYSVSNGGGTATAVIRVDVMPADNSARPIPDDDLAVLPAGGEVLVPVLANDTDPAGGILVLESVNLDRVHGVTAEVVDHELLRIRGRGLGNQTATVPYVVSNGTLTETGSVTVVPDNRERSGAPVAGDDTGVVRAGDIVTVNVLNNDVSPADRRLRVKPKVEITQGQELGQAFVSEDKVRFVANDQEGEVRVRYDVTDPLGNVDSGIVRISIRPKGPNSAPEPKPLTARLFQGGHVEIQVPLAGIDPDGDSATLVGLQEAPTKGSVEVDGDTLTYTATLPGSSEVESNYLGTDTFTYLVEDPDGAIGEGQVRVGIAQPPATNKPPVAITDERMVRTDRLVAVPVTVNDIDPEGEPLTLTDATTLEGDAEVEIVNGRLELRTPAEPGTLRIGYTIEDKVGAATDGQLVVTVDPDAPALPPIARDDRVPLSAVVGRQEVIVDVLANDEDPDGAISSLDPVTEVDGVEADADGRLRIPLREERQVVVYSLTDADGEVGRAVVLVPGTNSPAAKRPVLAPDADLPIEVTAGETVRIPLAKYVAVREGREPTVPFAENIHPGPGHDGSELKPDDEDVIVFGANPHYYGPTSVTATVADSTGEDDADAQSSVITFPIWVKPGGSTKPQLRIPEITVSKEEPWVGDLSSLATDPDPGDQERLDFEIDNEDSGLDVSLNDDTLTVALGGGAEPGTQLHFDLIVTDGTTGDVRRATVVQVLETTRPPITTRPVELDAAAGETTEVDLAEYATNPFEEEGEDLRVVGEPTAVPDDADISSSGTTVKITPGEDYSGTMVVTYVLRDATDLESREAQGEILLHVRGKPDAPSAPTADPTESKTVQVDWQAGDNNGAPITGYTLEWRGAGGSDSVKLDGATTSHTVTGLTNAEPYQFRVLATNEVGDSERSEWSREAIPDQVPLPPANVKASFGDGNLEVSWTQPAYEGSDVHTYEISYNGRITTTGGLKTTIKGLTNGTDYRIKVRGINDSEPITDGKQGASAWSTETAEHPNGEPTVTGTPTIVADGPDADPSALISWTYDDHGHSVDQYRVQRAGGATVECRKVSATSCRVDLREGKDDSFQVQLFNRDNPDSGAIDGWGPWSDATTPVRGAKEPGPVRNLTVTPTGSSQQARVTFSGADLHGAQSVTYYYRLGGGAPHEITSPAVIGGLPNGSTVNVFVWAVTTANGQQSAPGPEQSDGVNAFAPCAVSVSPGTAGYQSHTFNWSVTSNGRSCSWSGDGPGSAPQGSGNSGSGQVTKSAPAGGTTSLTVTVRTSTSGDDPTVSTPPASATGAAWPKHTYSVKHEGAKSPCNFADCKYVYIQLHNWAPNSSVYCWVAGSGEVDWYATIGTDGGGDSGWINQGPPGRLYDSAGARFSDGTFDGDGGDFNCSQN